MFFTCTAESFKHPQDTSFSHLICWIPSKKALQCNLHGTFILKRTCSWECLSISLSQVEIKYWCHIRIICMQGGQFVLKGMREKNEPNKNMSMIFNCRKTGVQTNYVLNSLFLLRWHKALFESCTHHQL